MKDFENERKADAMPEEEILENSPKKEENKKIKKKKEKKEKRSLKVRINSLVLRNEERREYNDAIYTEKLTEEKIDTAKPLQKGSVDMWFLLWYRNVLQRGRC